MPHLETLLRGLPVKDIPDGLEVLGLAVLILQVVCMLPRIDTQNGSVLADNWVLVCVGLDQDLAGLVVLHEPCPATALDTRKRCVELALEIGERAVRVIDSGLSQAVSRCYIRTDYASRSKNTELCHWMK